MQKAFGRTSVTDPAGVEWRVGIRWLPRRPTWIGFGHGWRTRAGSEMDGAWVERIGTGREEGLWVIVLVLLIAALWFLVLPIAVLLLDVLFLLVVASGAVAARVLFRRPWIVEAESLARRGHWPVVGWRRSRRAVDHVAQSLRHGRTLADIDLELAHDAS